MPLGAARLGFLSKHFAVEVAAEVIRKKIGITANGNAQIDTAQSKFGGASALFDGTGDYLLSTDSTLELGSGDWTIEFWFRPGSVSITQILLDFRPNTTQGFYPTIYMVNQALYFYTNNGNRITYASSMATGTWYHIAVSKSGSDHKLFFNGSQVGSTYTAANTYLGTRLTIGSDGYTLGSSSTNGHIDELRISDTARYTTGFTPSTTPFVNDENTVLLMHMDGTDASTYFEDDNGQRSKIGITANGNAQVDTAQSKFGGASALFDGTGDYLQFPNNIITASDDFTVEAWIRLDIIPPSNNNWQMMLGGTATGGNAVYIAIKNRSGTIVSDIVLSNGSGSFIEEEYTIASISANTWYHWAICKSGGTLKHFFNGTELTTLLSSSGTMTSAFGLHTAAYIGRWSGNTSWMWDGYIDEFRISNTARYTASFTAPTAPFVNDANTLLLIHADGTDASTVFVDDNGSGRAQVGVQAIGNTQVDTAQSNFGGASALFDGTDDRLEIKPTTTYNDFTVDCWIRLANTSGTKCVMSLGNESTGRVLFAVYNDRIGWDYYGTTSRYGNTSMSANTWYHLAWSRTGSTIKLFVDGVEQTMTTSSGSGVFPSGAVGNTNGIFIGTLSDGAIDLNGHIDEVRISNTARYTGAFTPSTTPFQNDSDTVLLLHMDGTDGSTVFIDDNGVAPDHTY